jgi:hypothetical protein
MTKLYIDRSLSGDNKREFEGKSEGGSEAVSTGLLSFLFDRVIRDETVDVIFGF